MDLERLAARARSTLAVISFIGVMVLALGLLLTLTVISRATSMPGFTAGDWVNGLYNAGGPLTLTAVGLLIAIIPWALWPLTNLLFRRAIDIRYQTEQFLSVLDTQRLQLEKIRETASLSDAAKQVAFRAQDLAALRAAIREDMDKGDFEAAMMLANEMERRFGYAQEADRFRDQITTTSRAAIDARVRETSDHVEMLLSKFEWDDATRETERLQRQFPTHAEVRKLTERIQSAKDSHKRELLKNWKDAIARDDIEASVSLLKQLDQYLSPSEAEAYKEAARDVFRKRLQQLQVQFALHVHDKNWGEALRIGQQITDEFPNTRTAAEVRERLPILQKNAQQPVGV
jgi:hypothetical protein